MPGSPTIDTGWAGAPTDDAKQARAASAASGGIIIAPLLPLHCWHEIRYVHLLGGLLRDCAK